MVETEYSAEEPLNREPDTKSLISSFITRSNPEEGGQGKGAYDRNHGAIPHIDPSTHRVKVDGAVSKSLSLSVEDLESMDQVTVTCALQCAGLRRHSMREDLDIKGEREVDGFDWGDGAVMNCRWGGVLLRNILLEAGIDYGESSGEKDMHVAFSCFQVEVQEDSWYGGSIELPRAMNEERDVLLALRMNGEPLTASHGAPVRVIVPGVAGARSVKWLDCITVQSEESTNFYQKHDYKILPPQATNKESAEEYWDKVPPLMDVPVNSVIVSPSSGETVKLDDKGHVEVKGYALPCGSQGPVVRVEVSGDEGKSWTDAEIEAGEGKWSWVLWKGDVPLLVGEEKTIWSRATDAGGNVQEAEQEWNFRGVGYSPYGGVKHLKSVRS